MEVIIREWLRMLDEHDGNHWLTLHRRKRATFNDVLTSHLIFWPTEVYLLNSPRTYLYKSCSISYIECEYLLSHNHKFLYPPALRSLNTLRTGSFKLFKCPFPGFFFNNFNPLNAELNPICYLLALLAHHFLHVRRIMVKSLTLRLLMSYIYGAPILDVSRSHTTTQHSR